MGGCISRTPVPGATREDALSILGVASLLADIGGTHARFAISREGTPGDVLVLKTEDFPDLPDALVQALHRLGSPDLDGVCACAAGPPDNGTIRLTNSPWTVTEAAFAHHVRRGPVVLVNDFTAQAAALSALDASQLRQIGGGHTRANDTTVVIGPGTGLGVAACLSTRDGETYVTGEGGHVSLAAETDEEARIVERLRDRFGHVSAERVLSGDGIANLFHAMHPDSELPQPRRGETVAQLAAAGDHRAMACVRQFCAWLGAVAGDLGLTFGARGGVFIGGGIVPGWGALFDEHAFRQRFEAKGRYHGYLGDIPTWVITTPNPALLGLARLLDCPDS